MDRREARGQLLESLAEVFIGFLLLDMAVLASEKLGDAVGDDVAFYEGKIASARFFAATVLPELPARLRILKDTDLGIMELDDAAFG